MELDQNAIVAIGRLIGQTGADDFTYGHIDQDPSKPTWYVRANYPNGSHIIVDGCDDPMQAAERMAVKLLSGSICRRCGKVVSVGDYLVPYGQGVTAQGQPVVTSPEQVEREGLCTWERQGDKWTSGCGELAPEGSTREKLAQALAALKVVPAGQIAAARAGRYDDYLSDTAFPQMLLIDELKQYGDVALPLIEAVKAGEFDGTKEEADAWAASEEGQAAFAELLPKGAQPRPDKAQREVDPEAHRARMKAQKRRRNKGNFRGDG